MALKLGWRTADEVQCEAVAPAYASQERFPTPTTPIPPRPTGRAPHGAAALPARLLSSMPSPWALGCEHDCGVRFMFTTHSETYRRQLALGRRVLHGGDWKRAIVAAERGWCVAALEDYLTGVQPFEWALGDAVHESPLDTSISVAAVLEHFRARLLSDNPHTEALL